MCSITWWHFQWPWRTPNPVFKVTAFLKSNVVKTARLKDKLLLHNRKLYVTWNGTMFVDLDWSLNASSLLSASVELLVRLWKSCDLEIGVKGYFKVIRTDTCWSTTYDFLLTFHSNHGPISYHFRDRWRFQSKIANFPTPRVFYAPADGVPLELGIGARAQKSRIMGLSDGWKKIQDRFSRLNTIPACDRQTLSHISTAKTALTHSVTRMTSNEHVIVDGQPAEERRRSTTLRCTARTSICQSLVDVTDRYFHIHLQHSWHDRRQRNDSNTVLRPQHQCNVPAVIRL